MDNKIDLDAIILKQRGKYSNNLRPHQRDLIKDIMKEAIHQALVLASENAKTKVQWRDKPNPDHYRDIVDKQSILEIEKLII